MGFTDEDANFEPDPNPKRWRRRLAGILLAGTAAFGGCTYATFRSLEGLFDGFGEFDFQIGWDELDETPVSTVPPQPDETCAALARVAWFTETSGSVWREFTSVEVPVPFDEAHAARVLVTLPPLRDALWQAVAVSPPPIADPLAIALTRVNEGIAELETGQLTVEATLAAFDGARAIDDASDALGTRCGGLDLIGPFDSYFVFGQTTTTTRLASS